jgi:hypothetical protein
VQRDTRNSLRRPTRSRFCGPCAGSDHVEIG